MITSTDALGYVTTYTYDETGNVLTRTDPAAPGEDGVANVERTTRWQWDAANRMLSETDAAGTVTQYAYNVDGSVAAISTLWQDELGADQSRKEASYSYDAFGNIQEAQDANNNPTTYVYDDNGNVIEQRVENGNKDQRTTYSYNSINQRVAVTEHLSDTESFTTRMAYDANGYQSLMIDANGVPTVYFRNNNGEVLFEVDALGNAIGYEYDDNGNVIEMRRYANKFPAIGKVSANELPPGVTDGIFLNEQPSPLAKSSADQLTQYQYDARNLLSKTTDAVGTVSTYTYDAVGNLQTSSRQGLNEAAYLTSYTHDLRDQLTLKVGEQGEQVRLAYDALGNIIESEQNQVTTTYTYDSLNRLSEEITARYDITSKTGPKGAEVETTLASQINTTNNRCDIFGNLTSVTKEQTNLRIPIEGDPTSGLVNGLVSSGPITTSFTSFTYDSLNRVTGRRAGGNANSEIMRYDQLGNVVSMQSAEGGTQHFEYDAIGRITRSMSEAGYITTYAYADRDNLASESVYGAAYQFNGAIPAVLSQDIPRDKSYTFDALNRVAKATDTANVTTCYYYDDITAVRLKVR